MKQSYTPPTNILEKYATLLVQFGLTDNTGKKLKKGSVVQFVVPEVAKPIYVHLQTAILQAGYHPLGVLLPSDQEGSEIEKAFYEHANKAQLEFTPKHLNSGLVQQIDGNIRILAESNLHALDGVNAKKVMTRTKALQAAKQAYYKKIDDNQLAWTLALYGTDAMAQEAQMSLKSYWQQIIKACYLDYDNPVTEWKRINRTVQATCKKLDKLQIQSLHVTGPDVDLTVQIGKDRLWKAGGGCNIPSYEVFTSPDCRYTEGWITFNQPLFRYGKRIENITLTFKQGKIIQATASKNERTLKEMIAVEGADRLGEFSLTDARLSRITKFMAETLYDENMGGKYGNTHVAVGFSFTECCAQSGKKLSKKQLLKRGFNQSTIHTDIISTTDRTVTATLQDGSQKVIYKKGQFTI